MQKNNKQRQEFLERIFDNFHAIKRAYSDGSRFSNRHFGVTIAQASVLMLLMQGGRKTMSDLASVLGVSKSAATQLLESLIERGLVVREQDKDDRRIAYVGLSGKGRRHLKKVRTGGTERITQLFDVLDDAELDQVENITRKLAERAKEIRK